MTIENRVVAIDINRDLLSEEVSASLPLDLLQLSGFARVGKSDIGSPTSEPRLITRALQTDGTYLEDFAKPGEIRFDFSSTLTAAQGTSLDDILAAHDATKKTPEQQRRAKDERDLDLLITNFPNYDRFTNAQRNNFLKTLARVVLRRARQARF